MSSLPNGQRLECILLVSPDTSKEYNATYGATTALNCFDPSYVPTIHGFVPNEGVYQTRTHYPGYFVPLTSYPTSVNGFSFNSSMGRTDQGSNIPLHHQGTNASPFTQTATRENLFMNLPLSQMTAPMTPQLGPRILSAVVPPAVVRPMPRGHKFECETCYRTFDRYSRLENCRNRHLGVEPHECLGRCGSSGCPKKYASIDHLDRHIDPYGTCTLCGEKHLKQNMSRHRVVCSERE